jgi:hypothetical protein
MQIFASNERDRRGALIKKGPNDGRDSNAVTTKRGYLFQMQTKMSVGIP